MEREDRMLQVGHHLYTINSMSDKGSMTNRALRKLWVVLQRKHPSITLEETLVLTSKRYFVCQATPSCVMRVGRHDLKEKGQQIVYNGLDASRRAICRECGRLTNLLKGKEDKARMLLGMLSITDCNN
jgi:hypothetical protein